MVEAPPSAASAYVHVPFCRHRCGYCDFTLVAGRDDLIEPYLAALKAELRFHPQDPDEGAGVAKTLFLGGGTPTHPPREQLATLLDTITQRFEPTADCEFSIEANPQDLTTEKLEVLANCGVNRISLGVQSFNDRQLFFLERDHVRREVLDLLPRVQKRIPNLSIDLIFGLPDQTLADWRESLRIAVESGATHISTYGLTIEPGTAFGVRKQRGQLTPIPEEHERELFFVAISELQSAGFRHYEISNFARPGFECRHNLTYWQGEEFHAYGPGASRYLNRCRQTNIRSVTGWLSRMEQGLSPVADVDPLSDETRARELAFIGLRLREGIDLNHIRERTGFDLAAAERTRVEMNISRGWLEQHESRLRLTDEGVFVADRVAADFL